GTPREVFDNPAAMAAFEPIIRADFQLIETYVRPDAPRLSCPIWVCCSDADEHVTATELSGWNLVSAVQCRYLEFAGGHFFLNDTTSLLPERISDALSTVGWSLPA